MNRAAILVFVGLLTILTPAPDRLLLGQQDREPLTYPDVFEIEFASDPQISPDGEQIVYARNYLDIMTDRAQSDLWLVTEDGQHVPFLHEPEGIRSHRWSPAGGRLAFVAAAGDKQQIHCYWVRSRRQGVLSRLTETPTSLTWSPDGRYLAFFMRVADRSEPLVKLPSRPDGAEWADPPVVIDRLRYRSDGLGFLPLGHSHLFVLSADGGTPRQLTQGDYDHGGSIAWTPDSQSIVFSANRRDDADFQPRNSELYRVDIASGTIKQLTNRDGPDTQPAIAIQQNLIGFLGFDDQLLGHQNMKLYVCDLEGNGVRCLTEQFDYDVASPVWSEFHQAFLFTFVERGVTKLGQVDLDGDIELLAENLGINALGRPYGGGDRCSVAEDGTIAFCTTTWERPGELARRIPSGSVEQLTRLNEDLLNQRQLGEVKELWVTSSHDQLQVQGWYVLPPDFDPSRTYPLILEIHGGPFANYGDRFSMELQLMAAQGYVVLYMNPRGSTSYGEAFANQIHHNYPGNDYDDLMTGVDAMIETGFIDDQHLYVTGGSGGGVLTAWIVGKTDRFRAAVVAKPVINWYSFALTADMYNYFYKYWFPGLPWEYPDEYLKRSPISLVGNVSTPTMLLTGTEDYRTPMSETEQFYQALKLRGVEALMVRVPGASHGIAARPSHLIAKVAYILKWFEKHR